jgi:hypothetical protein
MDDKEAIDYFLHEIVSNIKVEYNNLQNTQEQEDCYIISRLSQIALQLVKATNSSILQSMPIINYKNLNKV